MAYTSHCTAECPALERLKGAATAHGIEFEYSLAGLVALRLRRKGLSFQVYSNVAAARPLDDLVLRVLEPQPLTIFVQLKHASTTGPSAQVTTQAFTSPKGDFSLPKYFEFFVDFMSKHTTPDSLRTKDEALLHDCSLDDVRVILYTNRSVVRRQGATDGAHLDFGQQDLLRTDDVSKPNTVFSFGYKDERVWTLYDNDPLRDVYQHEFLPRLRVFSEQAHVNDLKELIRKELDAVYGSPLPRSDYLLPGYIDFLKDWAQDLTRGTPLTNSSGEVEKLLVEDLAKQGRAAAGGGALLFKPEHCAALRRALEERQGAVEARVRGVQTGHRAAKVVQVLDEAFAGRWVYVGDRQLREVPRAALEAACGAAHVQRLLLDVEEEAAPARALVAAVGCGGKVVAVSDEGVGRRWSEAPMEVEDWRMDHLTPEAQEALMNRTLNFQGSAVPLRCLAPSWRSMREDTDGALLSALARGAAAMGAALPAPNSMDDHLYLPRTLEHPATLDSAVVGKLDPRRHHLVLTGFPLPFLERRYSKLSSQDVASGKPMTNIREGSQEEHREQASSNDNKWWSVLSDTGEDSKQAGAFRTACGKTKGVNLHWLHCVGGSEDRITVVWKDTKGAMEAVVPFVQPASDACARAPTCVHAADAVRHAAAWRQRVGLLVGEPGMGKSRFLQRLAAEARARAPQLWTVLLQALDHRNLLRDFPQPQELTQEHLVELLAAAAGVVASTSSSVESARSFLKAALFDSGVITVFIDGVDEICPSYKDKLVQLLKMLLETKVRLVWVSSRPEVEITLTKALRCPSSILRPFSEEQQKKFLCRHWSYACNRSAEEFEDLAAEMVAALHGAAGRGRRSLLDVPLHAQMAAEAYEVQAAQALSAGGSLLPQTGITLHQLYQSFVDKKRFLYKSRFGLTDASFENVPFIDNFDEIHQSCAMLVLVSDPTWSKFNTSVFREYLDKNRNNLIKKEKTGILWLGEDEMPHFLHYTFIEYFAASWLISQLNNQERTYETAKDVWLHLLNRDMGVGVKHILEQMLADSLPLHQAVLEDSKDALVWALEATSNPNECDRFGRTALHQAASLGRAHAVDALLAKGCDLGRRDALLGWTALRYASHCGHLQAADRLLQGGADSADFVTDSTENTVLKAAEFGCAEIMSIIMEKVETTNLKHLRTQFGETPLILAAKNGHTRTVHILIQCGESVSNKDIFGRQPLHVAAIRGYVEITRLLLESGADPNAKDGSDVTPLMRAAERGGNSQTAQFLLEYGADVNLRDNGGWTALHWSTRCGHHHITKLIQKFKADLNQKNQWGLTPLMIASKKGDAQSVVLLLEGGADVNQRNEKHCTALLYAADYRHHEVMKLLLEREANPNDKNELGRTALMITAQRGAAQSVQLLLEHGADVNQCDMDNGTALHYATKHKRHQITKLLLERKADPNAKTDRSVTPLMEARRSGDAQSAQLLLEHGAREAQSDMNN